MSFLHDKMRQWSQEQYPIDHFADPVCACGSRQFLLALDEDAGVAQRTCASCADEHVMADGEEFLDDATLVACECKCGLDAFELAVGVALYEDSTDVRWLYVGGQCPTCEMCGIYGDWKNESGDYRELLARV